MDYFGREQLQINNRILADVLSRFEVALPIWRELVEQCFLSAGMKQKFHATIEERRQRLGLSAEKARMT